MFNYAEWALRHDQTGKISTLVDMLAQTNGILADALPVECQSGNAFEYTQVTKLPSATRRTYNQGIPSTMAGVAKLVATCSEYADWSKFDKSLAELGGNLNALRAQEDNLHMEGISQQVASDLFYSDRSTDPTAFTGLANIYNTVNPATSPIATNVLDALGTGSTNTSMWMVTWGPKQIHTIYPKGTMAGLQHKDMGLLPAVDDNGNEYLAYRTYMEWKLGLAIHDWRYAVRAANIDVTALDSGTPPNLINILVQMAHRMPTQPVGVGPVQSLDSKVDNFPPMRSAIYCNRTIATALDIQALDKSNVLLKMEEWGGKSVTTFRGIPIRVVDAILDTESQVT